MKKSKIKGKIRRTYQLPLFAIFVGVVGILFVRQQLTASFSANSVLGTTTLLAKGGGDSGGDSHGGGGSSDSGSSGGSNSGSGNSNNNSPSGSSGESSNGSSGSGNNGVSSSNNGSVSPIPTPSHKPEQVNENNQETGIRTNTKTKANETKTELRLSEGERIRTRTKDGQTRIDITSGGVKTRLEYKDGRVIIKAEQENGTEVELADNTLLKIDERLAKDNIKIATTSGQEFVLQKGTTRAITAFPLSVDLATNTLTVNTPSGQKNITVLPDQAVRNLIAANVVNRMGGQAIVDAAKGGQLSSVNQLITLGEKNGIPVYEIAGLSDQKLLGFIPIAISKTVTVSAQNGTVVSTQESLANKVLDLIAF